MEFGYVLANYGVDVIIELLACAAQRGRRRVQGDRQAGTKKLGVKLLTTSTKGRPSPTTAPRSLSPYAVQRPAGRTHRRPALMSVGFAPRVTGFGLENTGVTHPSAARSRSTTTCAPTCRDLRDRRRHREAAAGHVAGRRASSPLDHLRAETTTLGDHRMRCRAPRSASRRSRPPG